MTIQQQIDNTYAIEGILQSQEDLYERISDCKKLIKYNRRIQRQIAEVECILREKNEEVKNLKRILEVNEGLYSAVEASYNGLRDYFIKLQYAIFEVSKRVKEGIEVEVNKLHAPYIKHHGLTHWPKRT